MSQDRYISPDTADTGNFWLDYWNDRAQESIVVDPTTGKARAGFWPGLGVEIMTFGQGRGLGADADRQAQGILDMQRDRDARQILAETDVPLEYVYPDAGGQLPVDDKGNPVRLTPRGAQAAITSGRNRQKIEAEGRVGQQRLEEISAQGQSSVDVAREQAGSAREVAGIQAGSARDTATINSDTNIAIAEADLADRERGRQVTREGNIMNANVNLAQIQSNQDLGMMQMQLAREDRRQERLDKEENRRREMIFILMQGLSNLGAGFAL